MCETHRIWSGEANTNWNLLQVRIDTDVTDGESCCDTFHLMG